MYEMLHGHNQKEYSRSLRPVDKTKCTKSSSGMVLRFRQDMEYAMG
jgi:hypothetical protein